MNPRQGIETKQLTDAVAQRRQQQRRKTVNPRQGIETALQEVRRILTEYASLVGRQ